MPEEEDPLPSTSNSTSPEEASPPNWRQRRLDALPLVEEALKLLNRGQNAWPRSYARGGSINWRCCWR
ncbi:hypothetical protein ACOSQ3_010242 [Xanthoceras sorbifolium]